jgi:hypothetical protein
MLRMNPPPAITIHIGGNVKTRLLAVTVLLALGSHRAYAQGKDCNELKMEIAAKIEANGVKSYELTIVKTDEVKTEDKVVGSCGGGTMKIVYVRKDAETTPKDPAGKK